MHRLIIALLLVATVAHADPYAPPEFLSAPPTLPAGHDTNAMRLGLDDALSIAMKQNLGIALERKSVKATELGESLAFWSMYEPTLNLGYAHSGSEQPPTTIQAGLPGSSITSTSNSWDASLSQRLPTGGTVTVGMTNRRDVSSAGTAVEPVTNTTALTFSFTQPLFRGFSRDLAIPRYAILSARIASEQERHNLEIAAASLVQQTETAYWDVVFALYSYDVTVKSQDLAEQTLALVRRQIAAGITPASELTGAENTVAQREVAVLGAAQSVEQAWDALRTILNLPREQWQQPILPIDRPQFLPGKLPTDDEALAIAVRRRPELAQSDLDLESSRLAMRKAENDRLPQIDLGINTSVYGQGSTYGGALAQLGDHRETGWAVTLNLTWTPMQRATKTAVELARIQHEVRIANREQRVQTIWNDVRAALRNQRAAELGVIAASKSRMLANDSLAIENKKYATGSLSASNITIATLQNGLASAEVTELSALLAHEKARSALLLATGQLLDRHHIQLVK